MVLVSGDYWTSTAGQFVTLSVGWWESQKYFGICSLSTFGDYAWTYLWDGSRLLYRLLV